MRKHLAILSVVTLFTSCPLVFAETLDADAIKTIHEQTRMTFMRKCQKEMTWATEGVCRCLTDKVVLSLDDNALSYCTNDEAGSPCISKIVLDAAEKALSDDNINVCNQRERSPFTNPDTSPNMDNAGKINKMPTASSVNLSNETATDDPRKAVNTPYPTVSLNRTNEVNAARVNPPEVTHSNNPTTTPQPLKPVEKLPEVKNSTNSDNAPAMINQANQQTASPANGNLPEVNSVNSANPSEAANQGNLPDTPTANPKNLVEADPFSSSKEVAEAVNENTSNWNQPPQHSPDNIAEFPDDDDDEQNATNVSAGDDDFGDRTRDDNS